MDSNVIAPRNVTITNNATVTIPGGKWLNVDFTTYYLRILPGSKVIVQPNGRLYTLPLGHNFLNNTDGTFGYYLKRVEWLGDGGLQPDIRLLPVQHDQGVAAPARDAGGRRGTVNLNTTNLNVCTGGTNCTDLPDTIALCGGSMAVETLGFAMGRMMINSDNEDTNSIQELFGSGTPSAGRAAMNQTAWNVVGMSNATALQHKFNCGNIANNPYNTLTLADAGFSTSKP